MSDRPMEVYTVRTTTPDYQLPPMAYIVVDGKRAAVPCRLNLKPGDRLIVERKE